MKKLFKWAFVLLTAIAVSCGKDDDKTISKQDIIGQWKLESIKLEGEELPISDDMKQSYLVFTETKFKLALYLDALIPPGKKEGTYTISGNTIIARSTNNELSADEFSLSDGKLTLIDYETGYGRTYKFEMVYVRISTTVPEEENKQTVVNEKDLIGEWKLLEVKVGDSDWIFFDCTRDNTTITFSTNKKMVFKFYTHPKGQCTVQKMVEDTFAVSNNKIVLTTQDGKVDAENAVSMSGKNLIFTDTWLGLKRVMTFQKK